MKRRSALPLLVAGALVLSTGTAFAAQTEQGFCKKVQPGNAGCSGKSECSTAHKSSLPPGQERKC